MHCHPKIIDQLAETAEVVRRAITPDQIRSAIWHHRSGVNHKRPVCLGRHATAATATSACGVGQEEKGAGGGHGLVQPIFAGSPLAPTSAPHPSVTTPPRTSSFLGLTTPAVPVEKQNHLVEKFKAAKTRVQNAINDWNHPDQDL